MRIPEFLTDLVSTYGPYLPFFGSSPPQNPLELSENTENSENFNKMKHKKSLGNASSPPKGKGKGKEKASNSNEVADLKDLPITLPEFSNTVDFSKFVPRFSAVLKRNEQDGVGMEDIDALQMELEAMLSSTVVRKMTLKEELDVLCNVEKYRGQGKLNRKGPASPGKRGLSSNY